MKLLKKILPVALLILSSCGANSKGFVNTTKWNNELATLMYETTQNVIPYIELDSSFEYSVVEAQDETAVYILSKKDGDLSKNYIEILKDEGYVEHGKDVAQGFSRYAYTKYTHGYDIYIQFDYNPGYSGEKGFEIYTWSEPYVDPEINYPVISEWPTKVKNEMLEKFGELIPVAPFSNSFEYIYVEKDNNFIFTDKIGRENAFLDYFDTLQMDQEWSISESFYNQGYLVFEKPCKNIEYGTFHLNLRHTNRKGFIVDVWYTVKLPPVLITSWSNDCLDSFEELFGDRNAIPLAPISDQYQMNIAHVSDEYDVVDIIDPNPIDDFYTVYIDTLEKAGFVENDYFYPRYGNHVFEKLCPNNPDYNMVVDFMHVTDGLSIQIYKEELYSGTGFTSEFPMEQMKLFMKKYDITYQDFPEFPAGLDGRYLYTSRGPEFTIELYEDANAEYSCEYLYKELLEEDGWVIDESHRQTSSAWGYFAYKEGFDFYIRFFSLIDDNEDVGAFIFHLYPISYDCTGGLSF